jgi:hypothetical protein
MKTKGRFLSWGGDEISGSGMEKPPFEISLSHRSERQGFGSCGVPASGFRIRGIHFQLLVRPAETSPGMVDKNTGREVENN